MSDVYKIGVSLMMTSNAAGVLKLLGAEILGVHAKLKDLNKGLLTTEGNIARLNRIKLAVGGGVMMGAGIGLISGLKHVTDHARELSHELVQLQKMNIGSTENIPLVDALKQVQTEAKKAAEDIKGVTRVDALKAYGAAYSMFGHKDSMKMIQPMLRFSQVAGNTGGNYEQASSSLYQMIRAGDLMGKFVNERTHQVDTDKLNHFLELGSKVMLGTHGKVNAQAWLGLAQQGGPALSSMSDQGLYTMAIAAQAMGGPRAGTALTSLYQQMVGGKMTDTTYGALYNIGLAGGRVTTDAKGKKHYIRTGVDRDFQEKLKDDPITAVQMMQKQMVAHGYDTIEKQVPVLFDILGRQTTQRLVHDLLRNMPQIIGERDRTKNALGVGDSKDLQDRQDYTQAEQNLKKAWEDLMIAVAGPNSQTAINIMNRLTDAIRGLTKYVDSVDPAKIEMIGKGLLTLGAALTAGGAVALLAALGPAGWLAAGIATAGVAFANYKGPFEHWLKSVTGMGPQLDAADKAFNTAAVSFGKWVSGLGPSLDAADKAFNNFAVATGKFVSGLVAEISTWPSRIEASITAMGAAIVEKIKGVFTSILSGIGSIFSRTSFEGGEGMGGLIHRASYGGGGLGGGIGGTGTGRKGVPDFGGGAGGSGSTAFDAIMRAEGTAGKDPYNTVLGYGRYGLPSKPLTDMTLAEAYRFGRTVRARHGSSSAIGAFQIVGKTMKTYMGEAGLGWNDKFSPENQRKLARIIAKHQGLGAWEGFKRHPGERAKALNGGWNTAPSVPPPPVARDKGEQSVHLHVDGQKIASIVSRHQFRSGNRPATGANLADNSELYPVVG